METFSVYSIFDIEIQKAKEEFEIEIRKIKNGARIQQKIELFQLYIAY